MSRTREGKRKGEEWGGLNMEMFVEGGKAEGEEGDFEVDRIRRGEGEVVRGVEVEWVGH